MRLTSTRAAVLAALALVLAAPASAADPVGTFSGKFETAYLFQNCKDRAGHAIARTRCPTLSDGRQLLANRNTLTFRRPNGEVVKVPAGMITDLASIPRLVSNALPPGGPWAEASLPHDECYKTKGTMVWFKQTWRSRPQPYTRAECDEILREGMVALGVGAVQRITIYEAVRLGGSKGWGK